MVSQLQSSVDTPVLGQPAEALPLSQDPQSSDDSVIAAHWCKGEGHTHTLLPLPLLFHCWHTKVMHHFCYKGQGGQKACSRGQYYSHSTAVVPISGLTCIQNWATAVICTIHNFLPHHEACPLKQLLLKDHRSKLRNETLRQKKQSSLKNKDICSAPPQTQQYWKIWRGYHLFQTVNTNSHSFLSLHLDWHKHYSHSPLCLLTWSFWLMATVPPLSSVNTRDN